MATKPTLSIFTGDRNFGRVYGESNQITAKFFEFNLPFTNTEGNAGANLRGKTRLIVVQGATDGNGFGGATQELQLKQFVTEMEAWINAEVQTSITYTDSMGTSYSVYSVDWQWKRSFNDPSRIIYSLIMKQQ